MYYPMGFQQATRKKTLPVADNTISFRETGQLYYNSHCSGQFIRPLPLA